MSTNDGKKSKKILVKPPAAGPQPSRSKPKATDTMPKPVSTKKKPLHPASEIQPKSDPDSYRVKHPKSEIEQPNTELQTANSKLPTEPMEVHHHPQLDHSPKPIKEYLLEGFMIFIAVMMGFIAENIREGIDNNEQVKHLTTQLVQDLKADTAQLSHVGLEEDSILRYNDTLFALAQQPLSKVDFPRLQKMVANSHSMWIFHPSTGAIDAIKNQVHLSQFSNSGIIRYFAQYERHIELLQTDREINLQYQRTYLDPFLTQHFTPGNMTAAFSNSGHPTTQMRNLTQVDLDQLATDMVLIRLITKEMVQNNKLVRDDAAALLQYVKKQYNPDE